MVTIIKNQLLKHLSRFTKNLSPEQISLSALRGSGELHDLTLDEELLTDLLELPGWVRLTSARCNRASFRIQWTKLKTVPIVLNLDEVHIALAVCAEPRTLQPAATAAAALPVQGSYSYIHKVIDGISVSVNHVQVDFRCDAFTSSVQISRVTVESRTPEGRKGDLRLTRLKSPDTGQLLIFKELEWQSARVEAKAHSADSATLQPLRLLFGNTHCRIVIKKRLADCAVLGSRLALRPEPLAWALTDGQLRAALACAAALADPVRRATAAATRAKALKKVEEPLENISSRTAAGERDLLARMFAKHDVRETSYHLLAPRIDLHLCDDPGLGRSDKPSLANGGALQVTLVSLQADLYPYHKASGDRRHWRGYREAATPHSHWLSEALSSFFGNLLDTLSDPLVNGQTSAHHSSPACQAKSQIVQQFGKLMTTCLLLRIDDFSVNKVSTGASGRDAPRPLVCAEKATMPGDAGLLHAELTFFYYPGDVCFPMPPPKLYVQLSPLRVVLDVQSVVWLGAFLAHAARALPAAHDNSAYMDVRAEAIMPKIVLEAGPEHVSQQRDRPKELHVCTARATLTNVRESPVASTAGTRADLAALIAAARRTAPPHGQFPCSRHDLDPIHDQFLMHADNLDDIDRGKAVSHELLWRESRAVWCARAEPVWMDFVGARATGCRAAPLLDATPVTAWICFEENLSKMFVLARTCGLAGLQMNHYQMLFLLRQLERVSEMMGWLAHDANRQPGAEQGSIVVGAVVGAVELTLVLPSSCPLESRDLDSVPLDSSSLLDLKMGSDTTMCPSNQERDRDSVILALQNSIDVCAPLPAEDAAPPSPGLTSFGGFSTMRRGLTSLVTSIDSALSRDDARSDAASTASSDSERYVLVGLAAESPLDADFAFREFEHGRVSSGVEVGAEVCERSPSPSEHSVTSSCRRRDVISTVTWRLSNVHLVHQSAGSQSAVRLAADDLTTDECSAIPWDEFQNKFSSRARAYQEPILDEMAELVPREPPRISARLTRTQVPRVLDDKNDPVVLAPFEELLEARVRDLSIALNMSTTLALAEFIEDEVIVPPMPLDVLIENVKLHLTEDRPRPISSPHPQPLDIFLSTLRLTRDTSGVVQLGPPSPPAPQVGPTPDAARNPSAQEGPTPHAVNHHERLERENDELRKRLATLNRIADDNRELRAKLEETSALRQCVHAAQQEAAALLADKQELLSALQLLQEQVSGVRGKR